MESDETPVKHTSLSALASQAFVRIEIFAYVVLGLFLALTALLGISTAAVSLWNGVQAHGDANSLVATIDRLLFVLMDAKPLGLGQPIVGAHTAGEEH